MSTATLIRGDCLDVLKTLPDASVDAVVTDPPYAQTNEAYDSAIACNPEVWRECYRVAKPNAALVSFAGSPTYHRIASAIEAGGWRVRQMWGWVYRDGMITSAWPKEGFDRTRPAFDPICYAVKGKVLLTLEREGEPWTIGGRGSDKSPMSDRFRAPTCTSAPGRYPTALAAERGVPGLEYFVLSRTNGGRTEKHGHPNQKPLAIMRWIIAKLPGRVILDPFAGSAATLVAAIKDGRDAVGIEIDTDYFAVARERIDAELARHPLFEAPRAAQVEMFAAEATC